MAAFLSICVDQYPFEVKGRPFVGHHVHTIMTDFNDAAPVELALETCRSFDYGNARNSSPSLFNPDVVHAHDTDHKPLYAGVGVKRALSFPISRAARDRLIAVHSLTARPRATSPFEFEHTPEPPSFDELSPDQRIHCNCVSFIGVLLRLCDLAPAVGGRDLSGLLQGNDFFDRLEMINEASDQRLPGDLARNFFRQGEGVYAYHDFPDRPCAADYIGLLHTGLMAAAAHIPDTVTHPHVPADPRASAWLSHHLN